MEQKCRGLMSEQMSRAVNEFRWYKHSRLDGSLRPMAKYCIDKYVHNGLYTCKTITSK